MTGIVDIMKAIADPTRVRIMLLLRSMELAVGEIATIVGQSQPRVSRHVRILIEAGLIDRRKEGSWVFLSLAANAHADAVNAILADLLPVSSEAADAARDAERLAVVQAERAAAAERYFAQIAEQWDAIRSLHAEDGLVEAAITAILDARPVGDLVDVGTGTGRMIELLGGQADSVTAVDRSPDMLRLARAKLGHVNGADARLLIGDFYELPLSGKSASTVIMHQVLHFAQQPERVIAEAARVLRPGGRLLIVDFAPHDQEDLRVEHAHARLGFSDDQMARWTSETGLALREIQALSGGRLTVKLWLAERPDDQTVQQNFKVSA